MGVGEEGGHPVPHHRKRGDAEEERRSIHRNLQSLQSSPFAGEAPGGRAISARAHTHTYTLLALDTHTDTTVPLVFSVLSLSLTHSVFVSLAWLVHAHLHGWEV